MYAVTEGAKKMFSSHRHPRRCFFFPKKIFLFFIPLKREFAKNACLNIPEVM